MKTFKLSVFLVLFSVTCTWAQDYAFKVLANKGTNEVKSGDSWQSIKTGSTLKKGDELKLSENAYIGLVHTSGKPVELKQAGNYKIDDLSAKVNGGNSVLNKYTDFILSSNSAEAKKNKLSATGAVSRDVTSAIQIVLPENQNSAVYNTTATVTWETSKAESPYIVVVNNMFGEELTKAETPENQYKVDLASPKLASENAILVSVYSKADPSKKSAEKLIKKLPPAEQEKVKAAYKEIQGQVSDPTPLNKLLQAVFFEEHHLYIDAISAYEEAIRLAPDVPTYREEYDNFLIRNGMKR